MFLLLLPDPAQGDRNEDLRNQMVDEHIANAGINDRRVLRSMRSTPRHEFVKPDKRRLAYYDMAIPIDYGQTISPPYIVAYMTDQLDPKSTDRILEIGTGSGYQAAVLSPLVRDVYTIEIVEPLGRRAAKVLKRLGYDNVHTKIGDGFAGWEEHAPFDKIIVTCSPENIPQPLIDQLAEGGQIVIPVGERFQQTLCRFTKKGNQLQRENLEGTFFVPMTGQAEENREVIDDPTRPRLMHGSFEAKNESPEKPTGWYYLRQARVETDPTAPHGKHVLQFRNDDEGRSAHALQAFGADGLLVNKLAINVWTRGNNIKSGQGRLERAHAVIEFYGTNRAPVGHVSLGPWTGTFAWRHVSQVVKIPPAARLAVIGIGLFGATGELSVDSISIRAVKN
ncbi:MAG: protein-L-isoaspartate(D-aspartate) O-methyltransferase [Pirellulaceae bacterium]|nr:protein-L-isoaspartate(D-aspartate) O-methyltransferase [Pirellulaceae bacterium]